MKKVLGLLAITGFVACSNGESTEVKVDSAAIKDSIAKAEEAAKAALAQDTTKKDTTATAGADTTKKAETPAAH